MIYINRHAPISLECTPAFSYKSVSSNQNQSKQNHRPHHISHNHRQTATNNNDQHHQHHLHFHHLLHQQPQPQQQPSQSKKTFVSSLIIKKYNESMKKNEREGIVQHIKPDEAIRPPWSLHTILVNKNEQQLETIFHKNDHPNAVEAAAEAKKEIDSASAAASAAIAAESATIESPRQSDEKYSIPRPRLINLFLNGIQQQQQQQQHQSSSSPTNSGSNNNINRTERFKRSLSISSKTPSTSSSSAGHKSQPTPSPPPPHQLATFQGLIKANAASNIEISTIQCQNLLKKPLVDLPETIRVNQVTTTNRESARSKKRLSNQQKLQHLNNALNSAADLISFNQPVAEPTLHHPPSVVEADADDHAARIAAATTRLTTTNANNQTSPSPQPQQPYAEKHSSQSSQQQHHQQQNQPQIELISNQSKPSRVKEDWKTELLRRYNTKYDRPKYFVPIDEEALRTEPGMPDLHFKAADTYFYSTMPAKKSTFNIHPEFISESLDVSKVYLKQTALERGVESLSQAEKEEILKNNRFRRDYAFIY